MLIILIHEVVKLTRRIFKIPLSATSYPIN
jgi:hypothetical protein